jgi:hypothetical protein
VLPDSDTYAWDATAGLGWLGRDREPELAAMSLGGRLRGPAPRRSLDPGGERLLDREVEHTDGTNARQVTQPGASSEDPSQYEDGGPTFAPTGELLAFNRRDRETGLWAIFTVALDGTASSR